MLLNVRGSSHHFSQLLHSELLNALLLINAGGTSVFPSVDEACLPRTLFGGGSTSGRRWQLSATQKAPKFWFSHFSHFPLLHHLPLSHPPHPCLLLPLQPSHQLLPLRLVRLQKWLKIVGQDSSSISLKHLAATDSSKTLPGGKRQTQMQIDSSH